MADQQTTSKGTMTESERRHGQPKSPPAPGAAASPQMPGQVPDRSTVPGHFSTRVNRPVGAIKRPLTQYGTAQELLRVFPAPGEESQPAEFEQAPAAGEELRKAFPWQNPPTGPTLVFALDQGVAPIPPALPAAPSTPELPVETGG